MQEHKDTRRSTYSRTLNRTCNHIPQRQKGQSSRARKSEGLSFPAGGSNTNGNRAHLQTSLERNGVTAAYAFEACGPERNVTQLSSLLSWWIAQLLELIRRNLQPARTFIERSGIATQEETQDRHYVQTMAPTIKNVALAGVSITSSSISNVH